MTENRDLRTDKETNILVENSTWNNIGDGFYQFPIYHLFESMYGDSSNVAMIDGPVKRAFRLNENSKKRFKDNAFDISTVYGGDIYVISGPILGSVFLDHYAESIKRIKSNGGNYLILSSHSSLEKGSAKFQEIIDFFNDFPPLGLSTRDRYTFNLFNGLVNNCYDGICCAFYTYLLTPMPKLDESKKYITVSFYKNFEPDISIEFDGNEISDVELKPYKLSHYYSLWKYLRHFEFLRKMPSTYKDYEIIRPNHGIGTSFINIDFSKPNSYLSFNPLSYLSLYRGSSLTISDRVHSCVVTLAAGKPALFYPKYISEKDKRPLIFERAPLTKNPENGLYKADLDAIKVEFNLFKSWIKTTLENEYPLDRNSLKANKKVSLSV